MASIEVKVPDIGDFKDVAVIELLVKPGDRVAVDQSLITVESDKASMEIPSSAAGVVKELKVKLGDKVSQGSSHVGARCRWGCGACAQRRSCRGASSRRACAELPLRPHRRGAPAAASYAGGVDLECDLLVLGGGPGGYSGAFRAADLGMKVVLVERYATLGGVCLNVGCIPSKALLHVAAVMDEVAHFADLGVAYAAPKVDAAKLLAHKNKVVAKLTGGLGGHGAHAQGHGGARLRQRSPIRTTWWSKRPAAAGKTRPAKSRPSASSNASSPRARRRCACRSCPTTRASSTPPARSRCVSCPRRC